MDNDIDLNDIRIFVKVVAQSSFVGASKLLGVPRSTVSRRISELERRLGARLLERTTRSLRLTEVGETYYRHADKIITQVEEANLAVTRLQAAPRGVLRVTSPMNFGLLGSILASYMERYPDVQLEVTSTDRLVDLVQEEFDVALRAGPLADSSMIARRVGTLKNVLVASPDFLAANGAPDHPEQLANLDCLVFNAGTFTPTWTLVDGKRRVEVDVKSRLRANDMDVLRRAAIAGSGVALIPTIYCCDDINNGVLQRVLVDWSSSEIEIHALYPSARLLSPKLKVFVEHLRQSLHGETQV